MGNSFANVQVHCGPHLPTRIYDTIVTALRQWLTAQGYVEAQTEAEADRLVAVGPVTDAPWIAVYDEGIDIYDPWPSGQVLEQEVLGLATTLSRATGGTTLGIRVQDSDVLELFLCHAGTPTDLYSSDPSYQGAHYRGRRSLKGRPARWRALLAEGRTITELRDAFAQKMLFAEDTLGNIAPLLALGDDTPYASAHDLDYLEELGTHTLHLPFRLKERPRYEARATGAPGLHFAGGTDWTRPLRFATDDTVTLSTSFRSTGGPAQGLMVELSGEAIAQALLDIQEVVTLSGSSFSADLSKAVRAKDRISLILPDVPLPAGLAHPEALMNLPPSQQRAAFTLSQETTIGAWIRAVPIHTGQGDLEIRVRPLHPAAEHAGVRFRFDIFQPPFRRPVHAPSGSYRWTQLEALETPRYLTALVALGTDHQESALIAARLVETWHKVLAPAGGSYRLVWRASPELRYEDQALPVEALPTDAHWQRRRTELASYTHLALTLEAAPGTSARLARESRPGIAWNVAELAFKEQREEVAPHLFFWLELDGLPSAEQTEASQLLSALVDEAMTEAAGLQAFLARWGTPPRQLSYATPYELACDVHGQCTSARWWCSRFLRATTEQLWLGEGLLARLGDTTALATVADLERVGTAVRATLRPPSTLDDLEQALLPLLPTHDDWSWGMSQLYPRRDEDKEAGQ